MGSIINRELSRASVTDVRFTSAHANDRGRGLLGFLACTVDEQLRLDGITLRRTREGKLTLSYPERRDKNGAAHPYIKPLHDDARADLERQVFEALGLDEGMWES